MYKLKCTYSDGDVVTTYHTGQAEANDKAMQMLRLGAVRAEVGPC